MEILFFIIILLLVKENNSCMRTPIFEPITVPITTTVATTTTTPPITTTTTIPRTTTTTLQTTTSNEISTTTTSSTTTTTTTTTSTTTTTLPPCVPPAGSANLTISAADLATGVAAGINGGFDIPVTGTCTCGSSLVKAFSPGQPPELSPDGPSSWALELCFPASAAPVTPCTCQHQCACSYDGKCYLIFDPNGGAFDSDVLYYPFADGTFYAYVFTGFTFDDQTGIEVGLPFPFQVVAAGCDGCPALRAAMELTCPTFGPYMAAAG